MELRGLLAALTPAQREELVARSSDEEMDEDSADRGGPRFHYASPRSTFLWRIPMDTSR
jgi:hypothetical protein